MVRKSWVCRSNSYFKNYEKNRKLEKITKNGKFIKSHLKKIAKKHNLRLKILGLNSLIKYEIISDNWELYRKYIIDEMLKENILGANNIYVSIYHNKAAFRKYFLKLDKNFYKIKQFELYNS